MFDKTYELCPFCGYEVELKCIKYIRQKCPNCGKSILACSLCSSKEMNCNKCNSL